PDDSSVHRTMQRWVKLGVFAELWQLVIAPEAGAEVSEPTPAPASGVQNVAEPAAAGEPGELTERAA
ncbi:MAG: hypothetical protein MUF34_33230, partial [Polyangiaceae bacterium]|nr:hypothetical protein [Polyangiaceae bacterium]